AFGGALGELSSGALLCAALFGAASLWCGYQFFLVWDPETVAARAAAQSETEDDAT
ncbi:MAG: hypothetical protein HUJ24_12265, partial [Rhodobacteraceae bacterium]|nr:hypothetical protein [Paracoccaceae bacterium]